MKKKLHSYFIVYTLVLVLFGGKIFAQDVKLYRTGADNATVASFTFPSNDAIAYSSAIAPQTSQICGSAGVRVQVGSFILTVKSTSVSKMVFYGTSSGTSSRSLASIIVGSTVLNGTDYTTSSTIADANCGLITISGLNIPQNTAGTDITITFSGNVKFSQIDLTPIATSPLDFLSLAGKADALGKTASLNWSTTNEVNTKNFEIQKGTNNASFVTIGSIASKNTAGVHHYSFTDQSASAGTAYYKVLQFDHDGSSKSSSVIAVITKAASMLSVYPNPVEQTLNVNHPLSSNKTNLMVQGLDGKILLKKAIAVNSTSSILDVSSLSSGTYMLILDDQNQKSAFKFIKK